MGNESHQKPPRKRPLAVAFLLAILGLLLLDGAVQLFGRGHPTGQRWMLLALSVAFLILAVLWGSKRI